MGRPAIKNKLLCAGGRRWYQAQERGSANKARQQFNTKFGVPCRLHLLLHAALPGGQPGGDQEVVECSGHKAAALNRGLALARFKSGGSSGTDTRQGLGTQSLVSNWSLTTQPQSMSMALTSVK